MQFSSIKSRTILILSLVFLAVLAIASIRANQRRISDVSHALADLSRDAKAIAEKQQEAASYVQNLLMFLVGSTDLHELGRSTQCVEKLRSLVSTHPAVANIFIADANGFDMCNAFPSGSPTNVSDRMYFQRAHHGSGIVMGAPVVGRFTKKWVLPFAHDFRDATGNRKGVLVVALDLSWVHGEFKKRDLHADARIGLVTHQGLVLARYPEPERWIGENISRHSAFKALLGMMMRPHPEETTSAGATRSGSSGAIHEHHRIGILKIPSRHRCHWVLDQNPDRVAPTGAIIYRDS